MQKYSNEKWTKKYMNGFLKFNLRADISSCSKGCNNLNMCLFV